MATKSARKGAETEINRLRTQVRELQAQLSRVDTDEDDDRNDERDEDRDRGRDRDDGRFVRTESYRRAADDATETARDLPVRMMDEVSKLARGLTFAYLEQLRTAGEVLITFANEVTSRNQSEGRRSEGRSRQQGGRSRQEESRRSRSREQERESDREEEGSERSRGRGRTITTMATDLPADLTSGFFSALNRSLDLPGRSIERFQSVYRETEEQGEPTMRDRDRESERGRDRERRSQRGASARFESRRTAKGPRFRARRTETRQSPIAAEREETIEAEATT